MVVWVTPHAAGCTLAAWATGGFTGRRHTSLAALYGGAYGRDNTSAFMVQTCVWRLRATTRVLTAQLGAWLPPTTWAVACALPYEGTDHLDFFRAPQKRDTATPYYNARLGT